LKKKFKFLSSFWPEKNISKCFPEKEIIGTVELSV
jgi:hypothetical protein